MPRVRHFENPRKDQVLWTGSVVHWGQMERIYKGGNKVPITCGICKITRPVMVSKVNFHKSKFTGCHISCWGRARFNRDGGGITKNGDGYLFAHRNTFNNSQIFVLDGMFNGSYVIQHRAVMAIHLGRPLKEDELVHHLDGNRSNNDISNLRLLKVTRHHKGHGDDYYQLYQESIMTIRMLLSLLKE